MDALTQLVLLSLCVCAHSAPQGGLYRRHSDYDAYTNDYLKNYEPLMFAAIPLNGPVPVLNVLSRRPLSPLPRGRTHAPSVHHPVYARPPYNDNEYASSSHNEYEYDRYRSADTSAYEDSYEYVPAYKEPYAAPAASSSQDEVTILYARPNLQGGYSYSRRPARPALKRPPVVTTESPIILRVHKYRLVRDP